MPNLIERKTGDQFYATRLGTYDEMHAARGQLLPHWEQLLRGIEALGSKGLERRRQEAQRLLRENGVTYNVFDESQGISRPWQLDPVPLLISSDEWTEIEAGLNQRAQLLNLVLADLYGPQQLIKSGLLPMELVYGHPGFQRAGVGMLSPEQRNLIVYAANLARGPDGRMWVLEDSTQAPSGAGYALENRTVMTRILPSLFRDCQVHRLAAFFQELRAGLARIAPHHKDDPRVVVLTPGPLNETYFEHAYLAAYLGYPLAQGDDLTVRDGRVWLKSLEGLQQVDVILRRVNDSYCDPLELRTDSLLGIPGLVEAARRGHVAIANPIGSSILENPGLLPFLPAIARYFFGQDLRLPSVATWWCGQPRERDFVLENIDKLVIKMIHRTAGRYAVFGARLDQAGRALWRERILAKPHMYVGQERVTFSTAPTLVDGGIEPRHAILRSFLVAGEQGYHVMPGGLTRIALQKGTLAVSGRAGGVSKDTWVLAAEPEPQVDPGQLTEGASSFEPLTGPLPSRSADNLFWVGRYAERAESTARLLRTVLARLDASLEYEDPNDAVCLGHLLRGLTHVTSSYPGFVGKEAEAKLKNPLPELQSLLFNAQRAGSLPATLHSFGRAAYTARDLWSTDAWHVVDDIQQEWKQAVATLQADSNGLLQDCLDQLIMKLVAFSGLTTESMAHDPGWLLLDIGRRLERSLQSIALLRATLVPQQRGAVASKILEAVLATTESLMTFRRRYRSYAQTPRVLELLLLDEKHPRALSYQLRKLHYHINRLPREKGRSQIGRDQRLILEAYTRVRLAEPARLAPADDPTGIYSELDQLLSAVSELLCDLSNALTQTYFSHAQGPHLLAPVRLEEEL
ncbi:hypothetical protein DESUT3_40860 [Desulfuromonas versatilis]|uniref:DUF403 domain-containing protein n=1 Tax=Desulfuromonas versatilis TaxID=2802975 RepID=A0ABM8I2K3_9BACT|nr:circularly permuted type 2 ATP-grasp protein [Desulfuromonas versatilis]BCR07017.1 hypothetical protein DESUT3_40860 [Desulfuromonas versatilis]